MSLMPRMWAPRLLQLLGQPHVVVEVYLVALRVDEVAGVADGRLAQLARFAHRVDRHAHVSTQLSESKMRNRSMPRRGRLARRRAHHVVGVVGVADGVGAAQQHLEAGCSGMCSRSGPGAPRGPPAGSAWPRRRSRRPTSPARRARGRSRAWPAAMRSMSWVRIRVASSDWWASRKVVSVSSRRFCSRIHARSPSGPSSSQRVAGARAAAALGHPRGATGSRQARLGLRRLRRLGLPLTMTSPMKRSSWWRGRGAAEVEQLRRLVDEAGGALAGQERAGGGCTFSQEGDVGLHAADAELAQARGPCLRLASSKVEAPGA